MPRLWRQVDRIPFQRDDLRRLQRLFPAIGQSRKAICLPVWRQLRDQPLEPPLVQQLSVEQVRRRRNEKRMHHVRERDQRKTESDRKEQSAPRRPKTTQNGKARSRTRQVGRRSALRSVRPFAAVQIQNYEATTKPAKVSLGKLQ